MIHLAVSAGSTILATILVGLALLGVCSKLEVLGALEWLHALCLALSALKLEHNLLCCLRLLVEHRLRLTTESCLLLVVTALPLGHERGLTGLVLGDFVWPVLLALAAISVPGLWNVHHG